MKSFLQKQLKKTYRTRIKPALKSAKKSFRAAKKNWQTAFSQNSSKPALKKLSTKKLPAIPGQEEFFNYLSRSQALFAAIPKAPPTPLLKQWAEKTQAKIHKKFKRTETKAKRLLQKKIISPRHRLERKVQSNLKLVKNLPRQAHKNLYLPAVKNLKTNYRLAKTNLKLLKKELGLAFGKSQKATSQAYKTHYLPFIGSLVEKREMPFVNEVKIWKKELPGHTKFLYTRTVAPVHAYLLPHLQTYIPKYFHTPLSQSLYAYLPKWVGAAVVSLAFVGATSGILVGAGVATNTLDYQTLGNEFQLSQSVIKTQHLSLNHNVSSQQLRHTSELTTNTSAGQVAGTSTPSSNIDDSASSTPAQTPNQSAPADATGQASPAQGTPVPNRTVGPVPSSQDATPPTPAAAQPAPAPSSQNVTPAPADPTPAEAASADPAPDAMKVR